MSRTPAHGYGFAKVEGTGHRPARVSPGRTAPTWRGVAAGPRDSPGLADQGTHGQLVVREGDHPPRGPGIAIRRVLIPSGRVRLTPVMPPSRRHGRPP